MVDRRRVGVLPHGRVVHRHGGRRIVLRHGRVVDRHRRRRLVLGHRLVVEVGDHDGLLGDVRDHDGLLVEEVLVLLVEMVAEERGGALFG